MTKLEIQTGVKNPILRAKSKPVKKFDAVLRKFVKDMKEAMMKEEGLGIAAPQVGMNIRAFIVVMDYNKKSERILAMINPEILEKSEEMEEGEEGCLSLPGKFAKVMRHKEITVEFFDLECVRQVLNLRNLNARVVQHENDHIDGILFVDRLAAGAVIEEVDVKRKKGDKDGEKRI
ncbi:MAG: peptide deformylase [Candidatus Peregrinibacteria bacterium]|nr:peptide deformylase [Candidatus Peregrinibacteria bacterium]